MLTTLGPTFLTTGATLVAALSSRLMGVSSMVSLGAEFVLPDVGAAPLGKAAAKAIRIERLPHAADCWVKRDSEVLFMLFSLTPILHSGTYGILPYVTPCLTLRGAIRSKVTPSAGFVKEGMEFDKLHTGTTLLPTMRVSGIGSDYN